MYVLSGYLITRFQVPRNYGRCTLVLTPVPSESSWLLQFTSNNGVSCRVFMSESEDIKALALPTT
jgi:hypothetical protein